MIVVLVGPPGAGKGTQADLLVDKRGFRKISTGDALRRQIKLGTEVGKKAAEVMKRGDLVSDDILFDVIQEELGSKADENVLLDGYPRNIKQAETLQTIAQERPIQAVVHLDVARDVLIERLSGRRTCPECSATFHVSLNPPKVDGKCDRCGGALVQRPDDSKESVQVRLDVYEKNTKPILDFYRGQGIYKSIDGTGNTQSVFSRLEAVLA
ncbi:MAG: adenylate kinase [Bdellovibrionota bacterium]